jgi:hypothetical protein
MKSHLPVVSLLPAIGLAACMGIAAWCCPSGSGPANELESRFADGVGSRFRAEGVPRGESLHENDSRPLAADELAAGFASPPESTKPWCYWYWISDNISKEGISRDLESMARVGIGEAIIGNIFLEDVPAGDVKALSEAWWEMVEHAIREAGRVGVRIAMFNCPGWSQSGGPWIQPDQAMRYLATSEIRVQGPVAFAGPLPVPATPFQDVAVLAFPAPKHDADRLAQHSPRISCLPEVQDVSYLIDGDLDTAVEFSGEKPGGADRHPVRATADRSPSVVDSVDNRLGG